MQDISTKLLDLEEREEQWIFVIGVVKDQCVDSPIKFLYIPGSKLSASMYDLFLFKPTCPKLMKRLRFFKNNCSFGERIPSMAVAIERGWILPKTLTQMAITRCSNKDCNPIQRILFCGLFVLITNLAFCQTDRRTLKDEEYEKFLGQVLSTNGTTPIASVLLDVGETSSLKLSLPVYRLFVRDPDRNFFFLDGKIGAKNSYTPVLAKEKWLPDVDVSLSYTLLAPKRIFFYKSEIPQEGGIQSMPISKASSIQFGWINLKATYNYSKYAFYAPTPALPVPSLTETKYDGLALKSNYNFYYYPSRNKTPWLIFYGNVGFEYRNFDTNYNSLKEVKYQIKDLYVNGNGSVTEIVVDEGTARQGTFKVKESFAIPFNASVLFSGVDKKFYLGISFYGLRKKLGDDYYTDLGVGINVPIQKSDKTIANFTLKGDMPDVRNELNSETTFREKFVLGFTLGVPLIPRHQ